MGRYARHNRLCAAGIARKIVELYIADTDQAFGIGDDGEYVDRRAGVRGAEMDAVAGVGVDAADAVIDLLPYELHLLLFGMRTVRAERKHDRDIRILNPRGAEFVQQRRQYVVARNGTGHIACNDDDFLTRLDDFVQPGRADRLAQRTRNLRAAADFDVDRVGIHHHQQILVVHLELDSALAETQFKIHN